MDLGLGFAMQSKGLVQFSQSFRVYDFQKAPMRESTCISQGTGTSDDVPKLSCKAFQASYS